MGKVTVLGANVPRIDENVAQALIRLGLLYVGEDNELHVSEQKNTSVKPTTANRSIE